MKQWEELIGKINHIKFILQEEYPKIKPIARYLELENKMKTDLTVKAPK
jgi:hypothetical protein